MMYLLSDVINSVGLFLDIIGVILLFIFGLPSRFLSDGPPTNTLSLGWDPDSVKQWEKQWKRYKFWSGLHHAQKAGYSGRVDGPKGNLSAIPDALSRSRGALSPAGP